MDNHHIVYLFFMVKSGIIGNGEKSKIQVHTSHCYNCEQHTDYLDFKSPVQHMTEPGS